MHFQTRAPHLRRAKFGRQLTALGLSALAACSAGCGGGDDAPTPAATTATIEGAAIKGVVKNAAVEVFELRGDSLDVTRGTRIGTGTTTDSGKFRLTVSNYNGGAVALVVKGRAAGDPAGVTKVECDIDLAGDNDCGPGVKFGDFVDVGASFELTSCIGALNTGASNRFNATAFTQLLARRAQAFVAGASTAGAIRLATSEVNQLAGVNVVTTTPVDLTDAAARAAATPQELTYTALASGILRNTNTGTDAAANIDTAIDQLETSFANGTITAANLQTLVDNAQQQLQSVGATDGTGVLQQLAAIAQTGEVYNPEPVTSVNDVAVSQAKALVATIRNEVQSAMNLQAPGEAFGLQLDNIVGTNVTNGRLSPQMDSLALTLNLVTHEFDVATKDAVRPPAGQSRSFTVNSTDSDNVQHAATFTVTVAADNTITGRIANQVVRNENVDLTFTLLAGDLAPQQWTAGIQGAVETTKAAGIKVTPGTGSTALAVVAANNAGFDEQTVGVVFDRGEFNILGTIEEKGVTDPGKFEGRIAFAAERCRKASCDDNHRSQQNPNAPLRPWYNPTLILLDGKVTAAGNSARATIQFEQAMASAQNFDPGTDFDQDTVLRCFGAGFCFEEDDPNDDPNDQFEASYTSTNFMDAVLTVTAEAAFPNLPSALLTLAIDSDGFADRSQALPNGAPLGSGTLIIARGGADRLNLLVRNDAQSPLNPTLTITNSTGAIVTIRNFAQDEAPIEGEVSVAGVRAGTVSEISGGGVIVRYDDGSFETLFN